MLYASATRTSESPSPITPLKRSSGVYTREIPEVEPATNYILGASLCSTGCRSDGNMDNRPLYVRKLLLIPIDNYVTIGH
jgi:hypothetical protein